MAQFAVPDADTATGVAWSASGFARLDEGAPGDGVVATGASGNANSNLDKGTADITDPVSSSGHTLRARWRRSAGNRTMNGHLELWQGVPGAGTLIATLQENDIPTALTIITVGLTGTEADNITDYAAIQLRCFYTYSGGGSPSTMEVDFIELETPDAVGGSVTVTLASASVASSAVASVVSIGRLIALAPATATASAAPVDVSIARLVQLVAALASASASAPSLNLGVKLVALTPAASASSASAPSLNLGVKLVALTPAPAAAVAVALDPATTRLITLVAAVAASSAVGPVVTIGRLVTMAPALATSIASALVLNVAGGMIPAGLVRRLKHHHGPSAARQTIWRDPTS